MNIYIATRFDWYHQAALARSLLTDAGHHVTARWIDEAERYDGACDAVPIGDPRRATNAQMDIEDLEAADVLLVLVPPEGGTGMWLELGFALARCMRVLMVGPARERTIFAELRGIEVFARLVEAVEAMRTGCPGLVEWHPVGPRSDIPCGLHHGHDGPCEVRR